MLRRNSVRGWQRQRPACLRPNTPLQQTKPRYILSAFNYRVRGFAAERQVVSWPRHAEWSTRCGDDEPGVGRKREHHCVAAREVCAGIGLADNSPPRTISSPFGAYAPPLVSQLGFHLVGPLLIVLKTTPPNCAIPKNEVGPAAVRPPNGGHECRTTISNAKSPRRVSAQIQIDREHIAASRRAFENERPINISMNPHERRWLPNDCGPRICLPCDGYERPVTKRIGCHLDNHTQAQLRFRCIALS